MSTAQLSPGTVVDGRFTVGDVLRTRQGACTHHATGPDQASVELTIYAPECFPSALVLERSLRELRQLQGVDSDRIVKVLDAGKHGDGIFEVTEPAPGPTLAEHLQNGPVPLADAAALVVQIGEALLDAQKAGVIHRDLGAAVVFPSPHGVRVTGFAVGEPRGNNSFGALDTIAPEQVQGKVVDQRTLIYNVAALMHWMLSGAPLFSGSADDILQGHNAIEPGEEVHESLRRALGKDPRMRPMMLKQFLGDIARLGGVAPPRAPVSRPITPSVSKPTAPVAPAAAPVATPAAAPASASKPSSRGWTMFMQAADDDASAASNSSAPTPEPDAPAKPSTRGWTMFTEADDDASQGGAAKSAAPTPAAKPSTRGWTMFMEAQDDAADSGPAKPAGASTPVGNLDRPAPGSSPAPAMPPAAAGSKPSTRGWTMFMEAQDEQAPSKDEAAASPPPSPPGAAGASKPSTRGWTMFMEDEAAAGSGGAASDAAAGQPAEPAQPAAAAGPSNAATGSSTPSSRGWTMFMEDGSAGPGGAPPTAAAAAAAAPAPEVETPSSSPDAAPAASAGGASEEADAPGGRRKGWTMFMDIPLQEADKDIGGPKTPAAKMEADTKGWTVFGAPSPLAETGAEKGAEPAATPGAADERPAPERPTLLVTKPTVAPHPAAERTESRAGGTVVQPDPSGPGELDGSQPPVKGKTIVATGMTAQPGAAGSVTGRNLFGGAEGEAPPDTMYFKRGETEPERAASPRAPTVRDIETPMTKPAQERRAAGVPPTVRPVHTGPNEVSDSGGSKAPLYIVGAVVLIGAIAGAVLFLS